MNINIFICIYNVYKLQGNEYIKCRVIIASYFYFFLVIIMAFFLMIQFT